MNLTEDLTRRTRLASPCTAKWEEMDGDDRQRFCSQCQLSVLNASEMTDEEVMLSIMQLQTGARVCMRIYRRTDGTILTKDCPVGVRKVQERMRRAAAWLAGGLTMLLSLTASASAQEPSSSGTQDCNSAKDAKAKPRWHSLIKKDTASQQKGAKTQGTGGGTSAAPNIPMPGAIAPPRYTDDDVKRGEENVRACEKKHGPQSTEVATSLESVGHMYYWQQKYLESKTAFSRAFDVFQKLNNREGMRRVSYQMAMLCQIQKDTAGNAAWSKRAEELSKPAR